MSKFLPRLALALILAGVGAAHAADNYGFVPATNPGAYLKSKEVAPGVQSPQVIPSDASGNPLFNPSNPGNVDTVVRGNGTDVGGTITTAGTAQTFAAANANRRAWMVQNQSTGELRVNCWGATATFDFHSILIPAGQLYTSDSHFVGIGACSIIGATAGQAFLARTY